MVIGWPYIWGILHLGLGSFCGHLGPFWAVFGLFWAHFSLQGPIFGHFLAVMWPPTAATRELGVQTHGDRVALRNGTFFLRLGSFWGHLGPFWAVLAPFGPISASKGPFLAIFSSNVAADQCHPRVGSPNTW